MSKLSARLFTHFHPLIYSFFMKTLLKIEEASELLIAYIITLYTGYSWWTFFALLLLPDVSMAGYLINTKVGAWLYNLAHHKGIAIVVGIIGIWLSNNTYILVAAVLFGHSAMDRLLGYGLKYNDNFKHTHLGWIGDRKNEQMSK